MTETGSDSIGSARGEIESYYDIPRIGSHQFPEALPTDPHEIGLIYVTHSGCRPCEVAAPWVVDLINKYPDRIVPFRVSASAISPEFDFFYDTLNVRGGFAVILYDHTRTEVARFVRPEDKKPLHKKVEEMLGIENPTFIKSIRSTFLREKQSPKR